MKKNFKIRLTEEQSRVFMNVMETDSTRFYGKHYKPFIFCQIHDQRYFGLTHVEASSEGYFLDHEYEEITFQEWEEMYTVSKEDNDTYIKNVRDAHEDTALALRERETGGNLSIRKYKHIKTGIIGENDPDFDYFLHYKRGNDQIVAIESIPMVFVEDSSDWEDITHEINWDRPQKVYYSGMIVLTSGEHNQDGYGSFSGTTIENEKYPNNIGKHSINWDKNLFIPYTEKVVL